MQSVTANLASYAGQNFGVYVSVSGVDVAWAGVRPFQADYNGQQPVLSATALAAAGGGAAVPTGPATGTVAGDVATYENTTGQMQDSGVSLSTIQTMQMATATGCTFGSDGGGISCTGSPDLVEVFRRHELQGDLQHQLLKLDRRRQLDATVDRLVLGALQRNGAVVYRGRGAGELHRLGSEHKLRRDDHLHGHP